MISTRGSCEEITQVTVMEQQAQLIDLFLEKLKP